MSSGSIDVSSHRHLFLWDESLSLSRYAVATYEITSLLSADMTAIAIAMEQSAASSKLGSLKLRDDIAALTARVVSAEEIETPANARLAAFDLDTEVYRLASQPGRQSMRIAIAYPDDLLMNKPGQWLNVMIGEIPRLGFITSLRIADIEFHGQAFEGPRFGARGLRKLLGVDRSPLLCRATRPAVGLDREEIQKINLAVLTNGFHVVKDDELQSWRGADEFRSHVEAMVATRDRAQDRAGEKKLYIANLLCEPWELEDRLEIASAAGVDGLLLAPAIQGLGILAAAARKIDVPLLAHNSCSEIFTRHPDWCIAPSVYIKLQRQLGADWVVSTGSFATANAPGGEQEAIVEAAQGGEEALAPSMLIIQGGRKPDDLQACVEATHGTDFMLIVASWVDRHPRGIARAAREFRDAVDSISETGDG